MKILLSAVLICGSLTIGTILVPDVRAASDSVPMWAYGTDPAMAVAAPKTEKPGNELKQLPGADQKFTAAQIQNPFGPADWFPGDHPAMPEIVSHGRKPTVWACALCHFPNGKGKPENASVVGFPVAYFVEQMHEFRDGQRASADSRKKNTGMMASYAKNMTDQEIEEAAKYYGSMKWTPWIKVVETDTVPKTWTSAGMYMPFPNTKHEIGERVVEVPVDPESTEQLRNPHSGFVAYVPKGSIAKGKKLVEQGEGRTTPCSACHGADLKGMGPVPGIAGRSPSYMSRQLFDMQRGTRNGSWTELMKPVVKDLSDRDVVDIVAYVSSLKP